MRLMKLLIGLCLSASFLNLGCASNPDRYPAYSRSGRQTREHRPMNYRRLDSDTLYQACLKERSEVACRNRLGR